MPSLSSVGRRFDDRFITVDGMAFEGSLHPADEGALRLNSLINPRLLIRLPLESEAQSGMVMLDNAGRALLIADHDVTPNYRTHKLIQMTGRYEWKRHSGGELDKLTQQPRGKRELALGQIWAAIEPMNSEQVDGVIGVKGEQVKVITDAPLVVGDLIGSYVIRRVNFTLGVCHAEAE